MKTLIEKGEDFVISELSQEMITNFTNKEPFALSFGDIVLRFLETIEDDKIYEILKRILLSKTDYLIAEAHSVFLETMAYEKEMNNINIWRNL